MKEMVLLFSERDVLFILHSAQDAIVAKDLCDFLDHNGHLTITASESTSKAISIDISKEDHLLTTAQVMSKTLVLYSDRASLVFRKAVEQILAVEDLHAKTHILIFNTDATELQIPNAVNRRFTDRGMMTARVKDLLDGVGGMFMYNILCNQISFYYLFVFHHVSPYSFCIQSLSEPLISS